MKLSDRTVTILDVPLSGTEFAFLLIAGLCMAGTLLFIVPPIGRAILSIGGWR